METVFTKKSGRKERGGGTKKYGRNRSSTHRGHGGRVNKSAAYKSREAAGKTAKALRVTRALKKGIFQSGWFLNTKGFAQRES